MSERDRSHLISLGIEKTASITMLEVYADAYGPDRVLLYRSSTDTVETVDDPNSDQVPANFINHLDFDVVQGHFLATRFDSQLPGALRSAVLREPLQRMISHYLYLKQREGHVDFRIMTPYDPSMSFAEFVSIPELFNYQTQALGGLSIKHDFDIVGITENMDTFIRLLARVFPPRYGFPDRAPKSNQGTRSGQAIDSLMKELGIDESLIRRFRADNESDYANYAHAQEIVLKNMTSPATVHVLKNSL